MRYPAFPITDHLNRGHSTSPRGRRHRGAWGLGSTSIGQEQEALTSTSFKYPGPGRRASTPPARRRVTKVAGAAVAQARVRAWAAGSVDRGSAARGTTGPAGFLCSNAPLVSLRLRSCATDEVDDQHDQENDDQSSEPDVHGSLVPEQPLSKHDDATCDGYQRRLARASIACVDLVLDAPSHRTCFEVGDVVDRRVVVEHERLPDG